MTRNEVFHRQIWAALAPLEETAFEAIAARVPEPETVRAIEAELDASFPAEFVAFSMKTNGLLVNARQAHWPEPEEGWVGPAWKLWRGVVLLGFDTEDLPGWASLRTAAYNLRQAGIQGVAPIFKVVGDAGRMWGVDDSGRCVLVADGEVHVLESLLVDAYRAEIEALVARQQAVAGRR